MIESITRSIENGAEVIHKQGDQLEACGRATFVTNPAAPNGVHQIALVVQCVPTINPDDLEAAAFACLQQIIDAWRELEKGAESEAE